MAFVAEDGTGVSNANSLTSVEYADAYFADRLNTAWAALTTQAKQANLIQATDYIEKRWAEKFRGEPQYTEEPPQALSFPRLCIGQDGKVPDGMQKATAEYALRVVTGPLSPDPALDASGRYTASTRKKVGPIETETHFATEGALAAPVLLRPYPAADMLVRPFLRPSGGSVYR